MHYIFLMQPYPDLIFVTCQKGTSDFATFFSYSIFYRSAQARRFSFRFQIPVKICDLEVGQQSSNRVEPPSNLILFSRPMINEFAIIGFLDSSEVFISKLLAFLRESIQSSSSMTIFLQALTISQMVMSSLFLVTVFLTMGALQCGQEIWRLASFLSNYSMQGAQQLCWFMHIIMGAQSPVSNSPMHRKHSISTLPRMSPSIYLLIPFPLSKSIDLFKPITNQQKLIQDCTEQLTSKSFRGVSPWSQPEPVGTRPRLLGNLLWEIIQL